MDLCVAIAMPICRSVQRRDPPCLLFLTVTSVLGARVAHGYNTRMYRVAPRCSETHNLGLQEVVLCQ